MTTLIRSNKIKVLDDYCPYHFLNKKFSVYLVKLSPKNLLVSCMKVYLVQEVENHDMQNLANIHTA